MSMCNSNNGVEGAEATKTWICLQTCFSLSLLAAGLMVKKQRLLGAALDA